MLSTEFFLFKNIKTNANSLFRRNSVLSKFRKGTEKIIIQMQKNKTAKALFISVQFSFDFKFKDTEGPRVLEICMP